VDEDRGIGGDDVVGVALSRWMRSARGPDHVIDLPFSLSCQGVSLVADDGDSNRDSNMSARPW